MAAHEGQLGRLVVRAYLVALAVTLGGCSASEVVQNLPPAGAIDLPQPNYRRVVADNVRAIILAHLPQGRRARKTAKLCLVHSGRQDYRLAHRNRHRSMLQADV